MIANAGHGEKLEGARMMIGHHRWTAFQYDNVRLRHHHLAVCLYQQPPRREGTADRPAVSKSSFSKPCLRAMSSSSALTEAQIKDTAKSLSKASADGRLKDVEALLKKLKEGVREPTEEIIRQTKIGQTVGKLRNHADKSVADLAKEIVRAWKAVVDAQRDKGSAAGATANAASAGAKKEKEASTASSANSSAPVAPTSKSASIGEGDSKKAAGSNGSSTVADAKGTSDSNAPSSTTPVAAAPPKKREPVDLEILDDPIRNACLKLLYQSLEAGWEADTSTPFTIARSIEKHAFNQPAIGNGLVNAAYKNKIRSLSLNLKDKNNPQLRQRVLEGEIEPGELVFMTPEQMASDHLKKEREKIIQQNLFNSKGAEAQEAETDAFECARCKQRKCRYYQKQTRSADEPMTTFVICTFCNHRWKFS